jgi:prepilin-type N-terminal cleavage/methylation domain-containing protein
MMIERVNMRKGFTLLELMVVIVIIGILATLGFTQYASVIEKGRCAEAKTILGNVRKAEIAYNLENMTYAAMTNIFVSAPTTCTTTHYFSYVANAANNIATATRCTSGGKTPTGPNFSITLNYDAGTYSGTAGYF